MAVSNSARKEGGGWVFDTAAGKEELLNRRVGGNELFTIDVLEDLADAQEEYASGAHDGESTDLFAQKIMSDTVSATVCIGNPLKDSPRVRLDRSSLVPAKRDTTRRVPESRFMVTTTRY